MCVVSAVLPFHICLAVMTDDCLLLYLQNIYRNGIFAFIAIMSPEPPSLPRLLQEPLKVFFLPLSPS